MCHLSCPLPAPLPSPLPRLQMEASSTGSGTGLVTSKHPLRPSGYERNRRLPPLHLGSCQSTLVVRQEMAPEQVTMPESLVSALAGDRNLEVLAREGYLEEITLNEFSRSLLSWTRCFLGARQCEGLRGSEGRAQARTLGRRVDCEGGAGPQLGLRCRHGPAGGRIASRS